MSHVVIDSVLSLFRFETPESQRSENYGGAEHSPKKINKRFHTLCSRGHQDLVITRKDLAITTSGSRNYEKRSRNYEKRSRNYDIRIL